MLCEAKRGAGWGSRNPVLSLENLHINRYTNPARTEVIIPFMPIIAYLYYLKSAFIKWPLVSQ